MSDAVGQRDILNGIHPFARTHLSFLDHHGTSYAICIATSTNTPLPGLDIQSP